MRKAMEVYIISVCIRFISFLLTLSFSACVKFYSTPGAYIVVITICAGSAMLWAYNWYVWGVYLYQGKEYYPLTVDELIEKNVRNMKTRIRTE